MAATYTQDNTDTKETRRGIHAFEWDSKTRSQCWTGVDNSFIRERGPYNRQSGYFLKRKCDSTTELTDLKATE
jgi:hypothetical protein